LGTSLFHCGQERALEICCRALPTNSMSIEASQFCLECQIFSDSHLIQLRGACFEFTMSRYGVLSQISH
jgi:hypothetical protein